MNARSYCSRLAVATLCAVALSACTSIKLAVSRDYVPRSDIPPRSIHTSKEEHNKIKVEFARWLNAGHIVHLTNEGKKTLILTDIQLQLSNEELDSIKLAERLELRAKSTVSLPVPYEPVANEDVPTPCLLPTSLNVKAKIEGKGKAEDLDSSFTEKMGADQFREYQQFNCKSLSRVGHDQSS